MATNNAQREWLNLHAENQVEEFVVWLVAERKEAYHWGVYLNGECVGAFMEEWDGSYTVMVNGRTNRRGEGNRKTLAGAASLLRKALAKAAAPVDAPTTPAEASRTLRRILDGIGYAIESRRLVPSGGMSTRVHVVSSTQAEKVSKAALESGVVEGVSRYNAYAGCVDVYWKKPD